MEEKMKEADDEKSKSPLQEKLEKLTEKITQVSVYCTCASNSMKSHV
jgi:hypothetical protein